jgi:GTPase SAR1 family protein
VIRKVIHNKWGEGTVISTRYNGLQMLVLFDKGFKLWVKTKDVRYLEGHESVIPERKRVNDELNYSYSKKISKSIIESLRYGVVPTEHIHLFTVGRDNEFVKMVQWIQSGEGAFLITGQYGSGKTHLLRKFYNWCLENGYAVSFVELDMYEAPLYRPKKLYTKIIENFTYKKGNDRKNFRDLIIDICSNDDVTCKLESNPYFSEAIWRIKIRNTSSSYNDIEILNWIEGKTNPCYFRPCLYDSGTAANIYCNILSAASIATRMIGLHGLVIIFDEMENIITSATSNNQREYITNLLRGLIMLANNDRRLLTESINSCIGSQTGLIYNRRASNIRYAFQHPSYVRLVISIPDSQDIIPIISDSQFDEMFLPPFEKEHKSELIKRIIQLYSSAYSMNFDERLLRKIFDKIQTMGNVRLFIKGVIEILDFIRYYPNKSLEEIGDVNEY